MGALAGKVAVVTGASRGVGKGIALGLGEAGATVYLTGRTERAEESTVPLSGSLRETAVEVEVLGGTAVPIRCDHRDDSQVEAVFGRVREEQGRLDLLVNNAWGGYEHYHVGDPPDKGPFWEHPLSRWDEGFGVGVRSTYVATTFAIPLMLPQRGGLIVNVSFFASWKRGGGVAYNLAKAATDRLTEEFAHELRPHGITAVSLYPGLVRTEGVMKWAEFFDLSNSESPQFQGRAVAALAGDPKRLEKSGQVLVSAEVAEAYGFTDIDGKHPTSLRPYPDKW